jgi:hypothetical protein
METSRSVIQRPIFLIPLFILLLNDFYLKYEFPNFLTGKLSDFTGLFVFNLFWISLFPKKKVLISILTSLGFVWWKSIFSESFIQYWNSLEIISLGRVTDLSDLIALITIPIGLFLPQNNKVRWDLPKFGIASLAIFAFCATSYQHNFHYDKTYHMNMPLQELVFKLNGLCKNSICDNKPLSIHLQHITGHQIHLNDTVWYHDNGTITHQDTIWNYDKVWNPNENGLFKYEKSNSFDTIYTYSRPRIDTYYVKNSLVHYSFLPKENTFESIDYEYDERPIQSSFRVIGDSNQSSIILRNIASNNQMGLLASRNDVNLDTLLLYIFEKSVITELE